MQEQTLEFDVLIVGAGPAGLSSAIRLAQNAKRERKVLRIAVIDKAASIGGHIISGAILEPAALSELLPDWKQRNAPVSVAVTHEKLLYLTQKRCCRLPLLPAMKNQGNYIISLSELCIWLATQATALGVDILPGFAAESLLFNDNKTRVIGVKTRDMGLGKDGKPGSRYQQGIRLIAKQTLFAEGSRGSLSQQLMQHFKLTKGKSCQTYAIGIKELWKISDSKHQAGNVIHTTGYPLKSKSYGGGFIYHFKNNLVSVGLIVGLDYQNPYLDPFAELQRFKQHPKIQALLAGGECIQFGARSLSEGGWQSLPKLSFAGGVLVGCAAGMLNVGKLKGIHNALRSGMLAADAIIQQTDADEASLYQKYFNHSPIAKELKKVRNLRPAFRPGLGYGLCYAFIDQRLLRGLAPWTFKYRKDRLALKSKNHNQMIYYPRPDHKISFDKSSQIFLSAIQHREDQPCHLWVKDFKKAQWIYTHYAAPETRYCPAGVYDWVTVDDKPRLQINAANCIHCKSCDIKDPLHNIVWQVPEGGSGPNYRLM